MKAHLTHPIFAAAGRAGAFLNQPVYVVGGFVRDLLLKRPSKDIDIVTVGSGIKLAQTIAEEMGRPESVTVFKNFGTAMLNYPFDGENWQIEFVGARKESYRSESRKPIVETGSLEDDQDRRDFTINALAISLNVSDYGTLIDPFNGLRDMENEIIRTPLDANITFSDDPLRMMRGIRFAAQLGFVIENKTFDAIQQQAHRIEIISAERITEELNKIILSPKPSVGFKLLEKSGLLQLIFPELLALKGAEYVGSKGHKDNFQHTLEVLDNISEHTNNLWLRWAAILHDIGKPATKRFDEKIGWTFHGHETKGKRMINKIFRRLRLPLNEKMKYVEKLVEMHLRPIILAEDIVTDSAVRRLLFEAGEDIEDLMLLCEADITSKNQAKVQRYLKNFAIVRQKLVEIEEKDRIRNFQPPISGNDIMETFGILPCGEVGSIKAAIKEAILEGVIPNEREAAYDFMLKEAEKYNLKKQKGLDG